MKTIQPAIALALLASLPANGAVTYSTAGSSYQQNFNTLADTGTTNAWTNNTTLEGWYWARANSTPSTYTASSGTSALTQTILSLGDDTDRALGGLSDSSNLYYGMQITNNTGDTLGSFTIGYTGEHWRGNPSGTVDTLVLEYGVFNAGGSRINGNTTGYIEAGAAFNYSTTLGAPAGALDGNVNSSAISGTISGITWAPGQELWIRWRDASPAQTIGIDNVTFTASIPEPSVALLGAGGLLLFFRRRRS